MNNKDEDKHVAGRPDREHGTAVRTSTQPSSAPVHGILVGTLVELSDEGQARVNYPGNLAVLPVAARSTTPLTEESVGREVALLFENGDILRPIVVGVMQTVQSATVQSASAHQAPERTTTEQTSNTESPAETTVMLEESPTPSTSELLIDGRRIDLQAREEIVLRCGKSSITMTSAGKIIIRGAYVSSKSSGANRIKGGSVQIN